MQNLTFRDGNAAGETAEGGGAIFVRGGRLKVINSRFFNDVCDGVGPDVGGAPSAPSINSTIGVSYTVIDGRSRHDRAVGDGANPARDGTPGGGSGGAIYSDGNTFTLTLCGTDIADNTANEGGGAIFFVSNDRSGRLVIGNSALRNNPSAGFETSGYPGIFALARGNPQVIGSIIE